MKKNWILWSAVAISAYFIWKKMSKATTDSGKEFAPPPVTKPPVSPKPKPSVTSSENTISEEL